jgi:hypothetical protein
MKKLFTLLFVAMTALTGMADTYNGPLHIDIDGKTVDQTTDITIEKQADGNYTLKLMNFKITLGKMTMNVGNIIITDVPAVSNGQTQMLKVKKNIAIKGGSMDIMLRDVPIDMIGELRDGDFYTNIDIIMEKLNQKIKVTFGTAKYQLPNAGFETYHTATVTSPYDPNEKATSDEPDYWHSFMSASGNPLLVYMAGYNPVTFKCDDVRPGSTGKQSLMLKSIDMSLAIANGTITTGRMNTGDFTASNTDANYAWSDMSNTDKDAHGDPFYATLYSLPDAMKVWLKFKQGTANAEHPYATATAIINDGTEFHEPAPSKTVYTNVVGEARNAKIAETGDEWKEFTIPFTYDAFAQYGAKAKSVLVTLSTNADAGQGSDGDLLYVDDLSFVYNAGLKAITLTAENGEVFNVDGVNADTKEYTATVPFDVTANNLKAVSDGKGAYVSTTIANGKATIEITSNDLATTNVYTLNIKKGDAQGITSGINGAQAAQAQAAGIYTIGSMRVNAITKPGLYIVKGADGSVKKVLKK